MSILQNNLDLLSSKFAHVVEPMTTIDFNANSKDLYTESVEKDYIWLEAVKGSIGENKLIFVYGFGQGLGIIDLLEMYPDRWLFVYEPNVSVFYDAIQNYDLRELFQHTGFKGLSIGETQLRMLFSTISNYMQFDLAFVAVRHYLENDMEKLYILKEEFIKYNQTFEVNQHTMDHFRTQWMQNSMYQLVDILTSPSIESLQDTLKDCTAVVVGSGPSLQKDIEWLQKFKSHALIIAAGSSIQALVKHGIKPHLTVVMDGGEINTTIFEDPATIDAPLLITSTAYYGMSQKKQSQRIYSVLRNDAVAHFFMDRSKETFVLEPTSTVTGTAMQAAIALGAKKIIMMGQDLSFPENKFYAEGVNHAYLPYLQMKVDTAASEQLIVENVHGGHNVTTSSFLFMKDGLEELIAFFSSVQFINTTRNGAKIAGSVYMTAEEVFDIIKNEKVQPDIIESKLNLSVADISDKNILQVQERLQYTVQDLNKVKQELQILKKLINKVQELTRKKPAKGQQTLEDIEKMWSGITNRPWFEPMTDCMIPLQLSAFDKQLPAIITEKNNITKASLIYVHLGQLLDAISNMLNELEEIFKVSLQYIESAI